MTNLQPQHFPVTLHHQSNFEDISSAAKSRFVTGLRSAVLAERRALSVRALRTEVLKARHSIPGLLTRPSGFPISYGARRLILEQCELFKRKKENKAAATIQTKFKSNKVNQSLALSTLTGTDTEKLIYSSSLGQTRAAIYLVYTRFELAAISLEG